MITSTLKVILWDKEIGRLSWDGRRGCSYFEYSREFLAGTLDAFPLVASIKNPMSARPNKRSYEGCMGCHLGRLWS